MNHSRISTWTGSAVLAATAAFHSTGYTAIVRDASAPGVSELLQSAAKGLWWYASYHWLFVALVAVVAARFPSRLSRIVLVLAALLIAGDAVLLLVFVGPFLGEVLLAAVALAFALGAVLQSRPEELSSA